MTLSLASISEGPAVTNIPIGAPTTIAVGAKGSATVKMPLNVPPKF